MKKIVLLLIIIGSLFCVSSYSSEVNLKLNMGVTFPTYYGDDMDLIENELGITKKNNVGFTAGVGLQLMASPWMGFEPDLVFSMKGVKFEYQDSGGKFEEQIRLIYIDIPINMQFIIPVNDVFKPMLFAGPMLSFNVAAKDKIKIQITQDAHGGGPYNVEDEVDTKDDFNPVDFGINMGGGVNFNVGIGSFDILAQYSFGLVYAGSPYTKAMDIYNKMFSVTIGWNIPITQN